MAVGAEFLNWRVHSRIDKYTDLGWLSDAEGAALEALGIKPYDVYEGKGNLLLNEGIALLLDLLIGAGGTAYDNDSSYLAVGDSSAAATATQTALQASTNKLYKAMDATYPARSSQTLTFRSTFSTSNANFAWNEWSIANGSSDANTNLNRKVQSMGTKTSADTWVLTATITVA